MNRPKGQLSTETRSHKSAKEIWGLTGGIASGKSLAARFFIEAKIPVIDADQISRELSAPGGGAHPALLERFGTTDRNKLRELVFSDTNARRDLEAILHPLIKAETLKRAQALPEDQVIYEAALLVETGGYKTLSGLIVVEAPRELRKQRLITRDHISGDQAEQIIASQASDSERSQAATVIFDNSANTEHLRKQVLDFIHKKGWQKD